MKIFLQAAKFVLRVFEDHTTHKTDKNNQKRAKKPERFLDWLHPLICKQNRPKVAEKV